MDLTSYHKEELQLLLIAVIESYGSTNTQPQEKVLKAWIERIRYALKDK